MCKICNARTLSVVDRELASLIEKETRARVHGARELSSLPLNNSGYAGYSIYIVDHSAIRPAEDVDLGRIFKPGTSNLGVQEERALRRMSTNTELPSGYIA